MDAQKNGTFAMLDLLSPLEVGDSVSTPWIVQRWTDTGEEIKVERPMSGTMTLSRDGKPDSVFEIKSGGHGIVVTRTA